MPMVDGKEYPYTKAGKKAAKKAQDRKMYYEGGIVQYKNIKDKVKKCDAKAGLNTMK